MINALFQNNAFVAFSVPCSGVLLILYLEIFRKCSLSALRVCRY
jgi:hypothetical protein